MVCYVKYGETMNFGLDKQMERVVEVLALSALHKAYPPTQECSIAALETKSKIQKRLREIAFPLEIDL